MIYICSQFSLYRQILVKIIFIGIVGIYNNFTFAHQLVYLDSLCHPDIDNRIPQYIIGYGSLIQNSSKNKTYHHTGNSIPVIIYGYERGWFTKGTLPGVNATFLGVIHKAGSKFNGVIFKLPATSIAYYDQREKIYCREAISPGNIKMLNHQNIPKGQFWIYATLPDHLAKPSVTYPIVQSYVDIFLSGCLAIQKEYYLKNFASDCINTTYNWSPAWVNDRIYPRRPFEYQPDAKQIDELLMAKMPEIFRQIKIE